ncbi:hypothetical protein L2E82_25352 [Cichorium intybus]|uniref:Uncharacterized protein n=1 Tax=Cichorium intybus TaxID=13427 RepID=A0ACB9E3C0_CICIN|nr:hypothetical protein L2E82_25352 [Cichorium intybus]
MAKRSVAAYAILVLLFVLAISEIATVKGKLCEKVSQTWSGKCEDKKCDKKCIGWEKALHGACHKREGKAGCFCYFDCAKKPPKDAKPAPPDALPPPPAGGGGGSPPPADGGGSPPPADGGGSPPPADGGGSPPPSQH